MKSLLTSTRKTKKTGCLDMLKALKRWERKAGEPKIRRMFRTLKSDYGYIPPGAIGEAGFR